MGGHFLKAGSYEIMSQTLCCLYGVSQSVLPSTQQQVLVGSLGGEQRALEVCVLCPVSPKCQSSGARTGTLELSSDPFC